MEIEPEKQFLKVYDDLADRVFRHCFFRVSDRETAKDITQQAFMKYWVYITSHHAVENSKALIFKIVNNLIIDQYRKKREESLDALQEEGFDPSNDDYEAIMNMLSGKELVALLGQLDRRSRDVIVMRYVDDMSIPQIADITHETENTVSVRIHRGLKKVRTLIQNNYD